MFSLIPKKAFIKTIVLSSKCHGYFSAGLMFSKFSCSVLSILIQFWKDYTKIIALCLLLLIVSIVKFMLFKTSFMLNAYFCGGMILISMGQVDNMQNKYGYFKPNRLDIIKAKFDFLNTSN